MGFLAGGYLTPAQLQTQISEVRRGTGLFGVNLFAPNPVPISDRDYQAYAAVLASWARRYGVDLEPGRPCTDEDQWSEKMDLVAEARVPVVSVTFGLIPAEDLARLRSRGTLVLQTVTDSAEGAAAAEAAVDGVIVQSAAAGGHSGCWSPLQSASSDAQQSTAALVSAVREATSMPLWAAGGITEPEQVRAVLKAGAEAAVVGTALLCTPEAGTGAAHRAALLSGRYNETTVTAAFSGRPARALRTEFTDAFTASAPLGFPALHHLTAPMRRAAAEAGDPEGVNLWAGSGFRGVSELPAGHVLRRLGGVGGSD